MEDAIVSAVTHDTSEAKITVMGVPDQPGIAGRLFRRLADHQVNVDMIVQNVSDDGVTDISFTVPRENLAVALELCELESADLGARLVTSDEQVARVSVVGAGMKTDAGVAARVFETLAAEGINIEMISTSAIRVSCVIDETKVEPAVIALHRAFELDVAPSLS